MDTSTTNHAALADRPGSKPNDPLAKIRTIISKKSPLVQSLARSSTIHITSGLKVLNTRIQAIDDPSYEPLVTISDHEQSDEEEFVLPIPKLTKEELREELKIFQSTNNNNSSSTTNALLANDNEDDTGELQFRAQQPIKRCICCYEYPFSIRDSLCAIL